MAAYFGLGLNLNYHLPGQLFNPYWLLSEKIAIIVVRTKFVIFRKMSYFLAAFLAFHFLVGLERTRD